MPQLGSHRVHLKPKICSVFRSEWCPCVPPPLHFPLSPCCLSSSGLSDAHHETRAQRQRRRQGRLKENSSSPSLCENPSRVFFFPFQLGPMRREVERSQRRPRQQRYSPTTKLSLLYGGAVWRVAGDNKTSSAAEFAQDNTSAFILF